MFCVASSISKPPSVQTREGKKATYGICPLWFPPPFVTDSCISRVDELGAAQLCSGFAFGVAIVVVVVFLRRGGERVGVSG
ncbi:hypothetical protein JCM11641_001038 [Rhodosporidiobolus odoratus]